MWEALAPIIRWPLYSPARFASVVVLVLVGVFVVGDINDDSSPASAPSSASSTTPTMEASRPASDTPTRAVANDGAATDALSVDPATDNHSAAAADVAAAFVAAWAR